MLTYQVTAPHKLTFKWPDDHRRKGFTTQSAKIPEVLHNESLTILADAVVRRASRGSSLSCIGYVHALTNIFKNINCVESKFPPDNWDAFFYEHFSSHLENPAILYSVRIAEWHKIRDIYIEVQRRGSIPINAIIPSASIQGGCHDSAEPPLGYETIRLTVPSSLSEILPKGHLAETGLELDDDTYIENLREKFKNVSDTVVDACIDYWKVMRCCHQIGKDLIDIIPEDEIRKALDNKAYFVDGMHLAHPNRPLGINWFLAVLKYYLRNTLELTAISSEQLMEIPFFRPIIYNNKIRPLLLKKLREIAGGKSFGEHTINETLSRLLGLLSNRDCAAACCILIIENPSFPPYSLVSANLYTQAGKFYLRARSGGKRLVFSVDKPRAGRRKTSQLPELSSQIVADLMECTEVLRINLRSRGKSSWRKLFLIANESQIGCTGVGISKTMAVSSGITLYSALKPFLVPAGIQVENFNLSTLRSTQGILTFLEHGSLRKVADILNNTVQVVRARYIPPWLIIRWATRTIRIMQQKIIVVATEGTPWQLNATDFSTAKALRSFISKMLRDIKSGDAFSEMVRKRLGHHMPEGVESRNADLQSELIVGVDARSMAALYTYVHLFPEPASATSLEAPGMHEGRNTMSDAEIRQITSILTSAAALVTDELTMAESAIIDKVTGDSVTEFRQVHASALIEAARHKKFLHTN